jgi:DNA-directed RNA polymerase subunit RPC12/RpoP
MVCPACREESFLKRVPKYDGFTKVGEVLKCAACGHEFDSEAEAPPKAKARPRIFDDSDAPAVVHVFDETEKGRLCRYCGHFIVNPFTQRCGRHQKVVEATDTCPDFTAKPQAPDDSLSEKKGGDKGLSG